MGHATACRASLAVLSRLLDDHLIAGVHHLGHQLQAALMDTFQEHPYVGDIRGRGLFQALEFVTDKTKKTPFNPEQKIHQQLKRVAFDQGLICYPAGGTADGVHGDHLLLAPPFIMQTQHIDELVDKLKKTMEVVFDV